MKKKPLTKQEKKDRKLIIEALERKACGPIFGNSNSQLFRLAVGSFFGTNHAISDHAKDIERKADKIMDALKKKRKKVKK